MKVAELTYRDEELTLTVKVDGDKTTDVLGRELLDAINAYYNRVGTSAGTEEGGI